MIENVPASYDAAYVGLVDDSGSPLSVLHDLRERPLMIAVEKASPRCGIGFFSNNKQLIVWQLIGSAVAGDSVFVPYENVTITLTD